MALPLGIGFLRMLCIHPKFAHSAMTIRTFSRLLSTRRAASDWIFIEGVTTFGRHGVFEEEKRKQSPNHSELPLYTANVSSC